MAHGIFVKLALIFGSIEEKVSSLHTLRLLVQLCRLCTAHLQGARAISYVNVATKV